MYQTLLLIICCCAFAFANLNDQVIHTNTQMKNVIPRQVLITREIFINFLNRRILNVINETDLTDNETTTEIKIDPKVIQLLGATTNTNSSIHTKNSQNPNILLKIHRTITRSKDAVWATITLTFMCVILLLAVAQSKMWKDYRVTESQGVPLPNFNERVLFKDVMEHKMKSLKQMFKKQNENTPETEALLPPSEWDDESDIP